MVSAVLDGNLPTAPTVALAAARRYRTVLKAPTLSAAARSYLQANLDELERRASDPARLDEEVQQASKQTQQASSWTERSPSSVPGPLTNGSPRQPVNWAVISRSPAGWGICHGGPGG